MNKKFRKVLIVILSVLLCCTTAFGMISCKSTNSCAHAWGDGAVTLESTCTADGTRTYTCAKCNKTKDEVIPAGGHDLVVVKTGASCYNGGVSKDCKNCDYAEPITACVYTTTSVAQSCTTDGYDHVTCELCGAEHKNITARAVGHDFTGVTWTVEDVLLEDCDYNHNETATCNTCQEAVTLSMKICKHTYSVTTIEHATCSEKGEKVYTCSVCDDEYSEEIAVVADAHEWNDGVTVDNVTTYTCQNNSAHTKQVFSAKTEVEATVPAAALATTGQVELKNAEMKLDSATLNQIGSQDIKLSAGIADKATATANMSAEDKAKLGDNEIFDFSMKGADNREIDEFNGKITVTVPYTLSDGEDPDNIAICYIANDGKIEFIEATYSYVNGQGYATFETNHFSYYTVIRLSPAERCTKYGHKYTETTKAPSCGVQGYKLSECKRCGDVKRSDFTAPLTHNYSRVATAATCSQQGYTTYTCSNCNDKYVSDYVNPLAHTYVDTVVAPTCLSGGYTVHKCSVCNSSYTDTVVAAKGHNFVNGACEACGKKDPNAVTEAEKSNFYFNLIESVAQAESFCVEMQGFSFTAKMSYTNEDTETVTGKADLVRVQAILTEEGVKVMGEGSFSATMVSTGSVVYEEVYSGAAKFLFDGDTIYAYVNGTGLTGNGVKTEQIVAIPMSSIIEEQANMYVAMIQQYAQAYSEIFDTIIKGITSVENSPFNKIMATVVEFLFTKTEDATTGNYTFELNEQFLKTAYNALTKLTVEELFNTVFGEDALNNVINYVIESLDKTVPVFESEVKAELAKWGIDLDFIYDTIDSFLFPQMPEQPEGDLGNGGAEIFSEGLEGETGAEGPTSVRDYIAQMQDATLLQIIQMFGGEEFAEITTEQIKLMVEQYIAPIKEMKLIDLFTASRDVISGGGSIGGSTVSSSKAQIATSAVTSNAVADKEEISSVVLTDYISEDYLETYVQQMLDMVSGYVDQAVEILEGIPVSFTTDKTGALIDATCELKEFTLDPSQFDDEDYSGTVYDVSYGGTYKITLNKTYAADYSDIVAKAKTLAGVNNFTADKEFEHFNIYVVDGTIYAWVPEYYEYEDGYDYVYYNKSYIYERETIGEEAYNGQTCTKIKARINCLYVLNEQNKDMLTASTDCHGWWRVTTTFDCYYNVDAYAWKNADGEIVGVEIIDKENLSRDNWIEDFIFYYNPTTKEYSSSPAHSWKLIKHEDAVGCGYAYDHYTCTVCGVQYKEELEEGGHDWNTRYELKEGSEKCTDGIIGYDECSKCGRIDYTWESNYHNYNYEEVLVYNSPVCGKVYVRYGKCPCGMESSESGIISDCQMNWNSTTDRYECAINDCDFWYDSDDVTTTEYKATEDPTCYTYYITTYSYAGGKTLIEKSTSIGHNTSWETTYHEDGSRTEIWTCSICNKDITKYVEDKYYRTIRYENLIEGTGWYRVYTGCDYVEYNLNDEMLSSGTNHDMEYVDYNNNCTQYAYVGTICTVCGYEGSGSWQSPSYWWNDDHDYYWDSSKQTYVCDICGTENASGNDGWIVLEDMLEEGVIKVGYFNRRWDTYGDTSDITVIVNYNPDDVDAGIELEGDLISTEVTSPIGYSHESGIVTVDMDALNTAIAAQCAGTDVETISVVFWGRYTSNTETDPETGDFIEYYVAYGLTFTMDEIAA